MKGSLERKKEVRGGRKLRRSRESKGEKEGEAEGERKRCKEGKIREGRGKMWV